MATRLQITFDCWNVHMQCAWWAERLGYDVEDHHEVVQQLLDDGILTPELITTVNGRLAFAEAAAARDPAREGPRLYFQAVPEAKTAKNRLHLDVSRGEVPLDDVVADYVAAGAAFVENGEQPGHRWAVMTDPEGNEFCIQ
ncbi:MAG: hypothetical protein JO246_03425 [Frankiaceae bacterium]|nr:hypothetical protein [Frankiaceae bacterium]MBV9870810.1 hypothetical protein [Frankiaceae bacterium]